MRFVIVALSALASGTAVVAGCSPSEAGPDIRIDVTPSAGCVTCRCSPPGWWSG